MRHLPRTRSKYLVSTPSLIVIAFEISGDVALLSSSNSSGQHNVDQFHPTLMFGLQINSKGKRVLGRKNAARCESPHDMGLSICLTEVVFLRPKLTQFDRSTCKVRLFALGRGPFPKAWRELFCRW